MNSFAATPRSPAARQEQVGDFSRDRKIDDKCFSEVGHVAFLTQANEATTISGRLRVAFRSFPSGVQVGGLRMVLAHTKQVSALCELPRPEHAIDSIRGEKVKNNLSIVLISRPPPSTYYPCQ